jgi:hypothetical protein
VMGSNDFQCGPDAAGQNFDCSSGSVIVQEEALDYSPPAHLQACSVSGSGHSISLHLNHQLQVKDAVAWSKAFVGQSRACLDQLQLEVAVPADRDREGNWPPPGCSTDDR